MPLNQMMANTTQDSAGMPWHRFSTGARKSLAADERAISTASMHASGSLVLIFKFVLLMAA